MSGVIYRSNQSSFRLRPYPFACGLDDFERHFERCDLRIAHLNATFAHGRRFLAESVTLRWTWLPFDFAFGFGFGSSADG